MARAKKTETVKETAVETAPIELTAEDRPVEAAPAAPAEKTYTEGEFMDIVSGLQQQIEALKVQLTEKSQQQYAAVPERERVNLLWQAPVMPENVEEFGPNGRYARITGPTGGFFVPKDEFSLIVDSRVRMYLERRWLIVLSGLTDEERDIYGVAYKPGEYLTKAAFAKLTEQGEKLLEIYPALCPGNRKIVAGAVYEGWRNGDKHINRGLVERLTAMCRDIDPEETTFQTILQEMAEKAARGK